MELMSKTAGSQRKQEEEASAMPSKSPQGTFCNHLSAWARWQNKSLMLKTRSSENQFHSETEARPHNPIQQELNDTKCISYGHGITLKMSISMSSIDKKSKILNSAV